MKQCARVLAAVLLVAAGAEAGPNPARQPETALERDGWFHSAAGGLFVPLGGFHGNVLPLAYLKLSPAERRRLEPLVWDAQKTAGQGHVDISDVSDDTLRQWFRFLARNGVTAVRLFPRNHVGGDTLDLCGKLNPELSRAFSRAFAAARPYGIRFLLQILPEPVISGYWNHSLFERYALPRYSRHELEQLVPCQQRFLREGKHMEHADWFTDADVLACQKLYLASALEWVAREPQVFALEVYNEQGHSRPPPGREREFPADWEDAEIRWTAGIVRSIHERLPQMPVTISHPGHGISGYDPVRWSARTGVDFYSAHFYAGLCGEYAGADFAAVTAASSAVVAASIVNFPGEWGVLDSPAPEEVRRRAHRDALWLTLLSGAPGFMQWTYEFLDEYRWAARVFRSLPRDFSPARAEWQRDISDEWRAFESVPATKEPPYYMLGRPRRSDENLRRIFAEYWEGLEEGRPVAFRMGPQPAGEPPPPPLQAVGGFQLTYLADPVHRAWIAYLRSREVRAFGPHFFGVPVARPLSLRLDLPPGRYVVEAIRLGDGGVRRWKAQARAELRISEQTDADYVVIVSPRR